VFFPDARVSIAPQLLTLFRQIHLRAFYFLPLWLGLQFLSAAVGSRGVAWFAHIGGFAAGFGLAWLAKALLPDARIKYLARKIKKGEHPGATPLPSGMPPGSG
jgi:membrane associated rhomboid family serine protease